MLASIVSGALVWYVENCLPPASGFSVDDHNRLGARLGGRWSLESSSRAIYFEESRWREDSHASRPGQETRFPCPGDIPRNSYSEITKAHEFRILTTCGKVTSCRRPHISTAT